MSIGQKLLLLNVPFLGFVLCILALVIMFLIRLEKIFRFTYYPTIKLKAILDGLKCFPLNAG